MGLVDIQNITTTGSFYATDPAQGLKPDAYYDRILLETIRLKKFHHLEYGKKKPMPKNYGDTINFRRIDSLVADTTPLIEGVPPVGDQASASSVSITTHQYGRFMEFSDVVDFQIIDPIIEEYTVEMSDLASETMDLVGRDNIFLQSGMFYYAGNAVDVTELLTAADAEPFKPTLNDFRRIVLSMKRNFVKPIIGGKYIVLITPSVKYDLLDDPVVQKYMEYASDASMMKTGDVIDLFNMRFIEVMNGIESNLEQPLEPEDVSNPANTNTVHYSIVLGREAYGVTTIKGNGDAKIYVKKKGSAGVLDPIDQRQSIGFKINALGVGVLRQDAVCKYASIPTNQ